jgi:hypothetical protein
MRHCRPLATAVGLVAALIVSGCGGLSSGGYLGKEEGAVAYLQLTVSASSVSGTLDAAGLNGSGDDVTSAQATVSGTLSGDHITLTFTVGPSWLGGQTTLNGTVQGSDVVLTYTGTDGALVSMTFSPASTGDYNTALGKLQSQAATVQATESAAAEQSQLNAQVTAAAQQVQEDEGSLQSAVSELSLEQTQSSLQSEQADVSTMRQEETTTQGAAGDDQCYDAGEVVYDAGEVQYDYGEVQYDVSSLGDDTQAATSAVTKLQGDLAALQQAEAEDPSYGTVPDAASVKATASSAQQTVASDTQSAQQLQSQAKSISDSATAEANAFQTQYCGSSS